MTAQGVPIVEHLAHEAPLATGAVLFRAHDDLRHVENVLELEAADPRVAELHRQAKALRKAIAVALVDVAIDTAAAEIGGGQVTERGERGRFTRDPMRPLVVRLAEKISPERPINVPELGPCWPWAGARNARGYGRIRDDAGRLVLAHRAALALALKRPLRPGMFANHRCDWKPCVRPSHLYEGTQSENERDKRYWGPVVPPKGEVIATLRLFEEEVVPTRKTA